MKIIKRLVKGSYELNHLSHVDEITGVECESLEIVDTESGTVFPFVGLMVANRVTKNSSISAVSKYTDAEYQQMFEKELEKLSKQ